jgi:hypothetical protein
VQREKEILRRARTRKNQRRILQNLVHKIKKQNKVARAAADEKTELF